MIRAIYKCGSSLILPKPKDQDYVYYVDTAFERKMMLIKNHDHSVDNHYKLFENAKKVFLGCYIYPFMEKVEGEDIDFASFNMFEEETKAKYIALLKKYASWLPKENKWWYHIYIAVKMYDKGKINLTKTELNTAQKIHDNGIDDANYQYIIDYLNNSQ